MSTQQFEIKFIAEAEVTPGPVRLAMEEAERKKAEEQVEQGVEPADKEIEE